MTTANNFEYNENQVKSLWIGLSKSRLDRYKGLSGGDERQALELYSWNGALGNALYWPLHVFEITLRNAISDRMKSQHGDVWFEQIAAFSIYNGPKPNKEVEHINKAKRELDENRYPHNHDNIVAATTLGFWNNLFKAEYENTLYTPLLANLFDVKDREEAYKKVLQVKRLRNNVAHYEPIIVFGGGSQKRELYKDYKMILKMTKWLNVDAALWVESKSSDNFFEIWNSVPSFFEVLPLDKRQGKEGDSDFWQWYTPDSPIKKM